MFNGQAVVCRDGGGAEPELKERGRTGRAGGTLTAEQTTATSAAERARRWASCKVYSNVICHYITEAGTQQSHSTLQPKNMHTDTHQQQQQASQHLRSFLFCLYQGSWQVDLVDLFSSSLGIKHTVFLAALIQITENTFQL